MKSYNAQASTFNIKACIIIINVSFLPVLFNEITVKDTIYYMWITESNRPKHLIGGVLSSIVGTILFTAGLAIGMEFKDKMYGNKFDWLDVAATMIGGVIGQIITMLLFLVILKYRG